MCKGGGNGCIVRSHGGKGTRSGGSAVATCPGRATPTSATPYYAELARILVGARTLSSGRGASKCSPGARMGSEGACESSVSASLCVSGGRVLVCACACVCVCVCARARAPALCHTSPIPSPELWPRPELQSPKPLPPCPSQGAHPQSVLPHPALPPQDTHPSPGPRTH